MQVIPTTYNGIRFRSRIEARWAVFYDALGIPWQYEQEGYKLDGGLCYLPDFSLTDFMSAGHRAFIEIKGGYPTADEISKAEALVAATYDVLFIFYVGVDVSPDQQGNDSALCIGPHGIIDSQFWWCQCRHCETVGIQWQGHADRLHCGCHIERGEDHIQGHDTPPC